MNDRSISRSVAKPELPAASKIRVSPFSWMKASTKLITC